MGCARADGKGRGVGMRLAALRFEALRLPCLLLALALYGLLSSPTPADPGPVELAIGVLLVAAVGPGHGLMVAAGFSLRRTPRPAHEVIGVPVFALLLWGWLLRGFMAGWEIADVIRDVVPLVYFVLPLFLARLIGAGGERLLRWLAMAIAVVGVVFAWRYYRISGATVGRLRHAVPSDHLLYLPNSLSMQFAAVLLPLAALERLTRPSLGRLATAALMIGGGVLCLSALAATLQRAALGLAAVALCAGLVLGCRGRPGLLLLLPVGVAAVLWLFWPQVSGLTLLLLLKTQIVGLNRHDSEIAVALESAGQSLVHALFGTGWGALIETPAVPGMAVSYLHALPLYFLVKTGLVGTALALGWLASLLPGLRALWRRHPPICLALLAPLTVGSVFQPSFKSLDYGLLLTLLAVAAVSPAARPAGAEDRG